MLLLRLCGEFDLVDLKLTLKLGVVEEVRRHTEESVSLWSGPPGWKVNDETVLGSEWVKVSHQGILVMTGPGSSSVIVGVIVPLTIVSDHGHESDSVMVGHPGGSAVPDQSSVHEGLG
jgi:hypothetical protein